MSATHRTRKLLYVVAGHHAILAELRTMSGLLRTERQDRMCIVRTKTLCVVYTIGRWNNDIIYSRSLQTVPNKL